MEFYEKSRVDKVKYAYELSSKLIKKGYSPDFDDENSFLEFYFTTNVLLPGGVTSLMVIPLIKVLGSEK